MKKIVLVVLSIIVVVAVVVGVRTYGARNQTDSVSTKDASKLVGGAKSGAATSTAADPGERPKPGTYTYKGAGSEHVSILGGSEHVFPSSIPVVVDLKGGKASDCGWAWNLIYVKQHVEERDFCTTSTTVTDAGFTRSIEFFAQTQKAHYDCGSDAVRLRRSAKPGDTWTWKCENKDGNAVGTYTLTELAPAKLMIDGESITAAHTRVTQVQKGDTSGTGTDEYWLAPNGLPLRFSGKLDVTTKSVLGTTKFGEQEQYELTSLDPRALSTPDATA